VTLAEEGSGTFFFKYCYVNIQEVKVAVRLSFFFFWCIECWDVCEVVKKMRPDHECVTHLMEPTCGLVERPAEVPPQSLP
jgi:hypothetical protein